MPLQTVRGTLSAAVANLGTFTVSYPTNTDSGTFTGAVNHKININQVDLTSPKSFILTFGTSSITVTNETGSSWPVGANYILQLNTAGNKPIGGFDNGLMPTVGCTQSILTRVNLGAPDVLDADGICASQSVTAATQAVVNGAVGATLDTPRNVVAAWTTTSVLTIIGRDIYGNLLTESSASSTSFTGKKAFKTITSILFSISVTGATVGTGDVIGIPIFLQSSSQVLAELQDNVVLSRGAGTRAYQGSLVDVSTASTTYIPVSVAGRVKAVYISLSAAVSGSDSTVTVSTAAGTVGTITIPVSGSAAGQVLSLTTGLNNTAIAAGAVVTVATDGASSTVSIGTIVVEVDTGGTYVAGDQTTAGSTATTGDIRGTYKPNAACDGAKAFTLLLALDNPEYAGLAQYNA